MLFASVLNAQGVRVILANGDIVEQAGVGTKRVGNAELSVERVHAGRFDVELRNPTALPFGIGGLRRGTPLFLTHAALATPKGWTLSWAEEREAARAMEWNGQDVWAILGPWHRRTTDLALEESARWHHLMGGESLRWQMLAEAELPPSRTSEVADRCRLALGSVPAEDRALLAARYPRLDALRRQCTLPAEAPPWATPPGGRTLGWYLHWWHKRFDYGHSSPARGPFDWGVLPWSGGNSNAHYDTVAWCVENWLDTGDVGAWRLALLLARQMATRGFTRSDEPLPFPGWPAGYMNHCWQFEKTNTERPDSDGRKGLGHPGNYMPPHSSHAWDLGVLMTAELSNDPHLQRTVALRKAFLMGVGHERIWDGGFGIRPAAWHLRNLHAFRTLHNDAALDACAERFLDHCMKLVPKDVPWPRDAGAPEWQTPWQTALFVSEAARWRERGVGAAHWPRLVELWRWVLDKATTFTNEACGECLKGAYRVRISADGKEQVTEWLAPISTPLLLPLCAEMAKEDPRYARHLAAAQRTAGAAAWRGFGALAAQGPPEESDWGSSQYPGSMPKAAAELLLGARPIYLR